MQDDRGPLGAGGQAWYESPTEAQPDWANRRSHRDEGLRVRRPGRGHVSTDDWLSMEISINHESL
jgi:hypothetical protein